MRNTEPEKRTKLKAMRLSQGITLELVSQKTGITCPSVCAQEKKGVFDIRTAEKYAAAFRCPALFLLERLDK